MEKTQRTTGLLHCKLGVENPGDDRAYLELESRRF